MAVGDAYGAEQWREGTEGAEDEVALRTERISRGSCRAVAEYSFRSAKRMDARVYGGPKWTVSPVYEGMLKEEMDAAAERHSDIDYEPVLIDATYAGLVSGAISGPAVIPALNRDGDCLSDFVLPLYGSIAGAESVLLAFDDDYEVTAAMSEAPHGTAPGLLGKNIANPMAMILAGAAVLHYVAQVTDTDEAETASQAIYDASSSQPGGHPDHRPRWRGLDDRLHRRGHLARAGAAQELTAGAGGRLFVLAPPRPAACRADPSIVSAAAPQVEEPLHVEGDHPGHEDGHEVERRAAALAPPASDQSS